MTTPKPVFGNTMTNTMTDGRTGDHLTAIPVFDDTIETSSMYLSGAHMVRLVEADEEWPRSGRYAAVSRSCRKRSRGPTAALLSGEAKEKTEATWPSLRRAVGREQGG